MSSEIVQVAKKSRLKETQKGQKILKDLKKSGKLSSANKTDLPNNQIVSLTTKLLGLKGDYEAIHSAMLEAFR